MNRAVHSLFALLFALLCASPLLAEGMSLKQIAELRSVSQALISPDGGHIAYLLAVPRLPGEDEDGPAWTELHVIDGNGRSRLYVGDRNAIGGLAWLPDGSGLAFLSKRGKDEYQALYRIDLGGGEARRVASLKSDIRGFSYAPDASQVALVAMKEEDPARKKLREQGFSQKVLEEDGQPWLLWIHTPEQDDAKPRQLQLDGSVQEVNWSPAGDRLAIKLSPRELVDDVIMDSRVRIIRPDGSEIGRVDNPGKLGSIAWSPDGAHLAVIAAEDINDPREGRLTVVSADGGAQRDLLPGLEGHVWHVAWKDAGRLLFISYEGVEARLGEIGVDGSDQRTLLAAGGPIWSGLSASRSGDLALLANTPAHPNEVYRYSRNTGQAARLSNSNPWLSEVTLGRQEVIRYAARDGLQIEGILVHPLQRAEGQRVPLILNVHGGPEAHYSNGWLTGYAQPAQHAAGRGFATFFPNYRASTGRGVAFSKLNHGRPAKEEFDDLVDGVDHLIEIGLADKDKVGITGGSYGGYATAWGATYYSERFAAAVMNVGLSDKIGMLGTTDIARELYLVHYQTWPWENWTLYTEASPIYYAQQSRTPTLILHGDADPRVDPTQSRTMYRYLKLAGKAPVRLVLYPGEGHGNQRAASRWDYSLRLMRWMEHYLMGEGGEPPAFEIDYQLPVEERADQPAE
jgi:dipeptidyl aminopeptidase/acylaminoacyl peptidase